MTISAASLNDPPSLSVCEEMGIFSCGSGGHVGIYDLEIGDPLRILSAPYPKKEYNPCVTTCLKMEAGRGQIGTNPGLFYSFPGDEGVFHFSFGER